MSFNHLLIDQIIEEKRIQNKLIYLGWRPSNSFDIHK